MFRFLLCGASGSGKTNVALCLIYKYIHWDKLYLYTRTPEQEVYKTLRKFMEKSTNELRRKLKDDNLEIFYESSDLESGIISVYDMNPELQNLVVFDDVLTIKDQSKIIDFFVLGRHRNISVLYLSQSYFGTPKTIRINCSHFAFFNIPSANEISLISRDHGLDISKEKFKELIKEAMDEPYSFFFLDKVSPFLCMRYRKRFDGIFDCLKNSRNIENDKLGS